MNNKKNFGKDFFDSEEESLIFRYEEMLAHGRSGYFDVSECEEIIDYYSEHAEMKKAMQAVALAEKLHPLSPSIQLIKASLLAFDNKPRKALNIIADLEQAEYAHDIDRYRLKMTKAFSLILLERFEEAIALQQDLLENEAFSKADTEQVLILITSGLLEQGRYEEAIQNLQSFENKIQLSPNLLWHIAYAFTELEDFDSAAKYYKKGIAQDPFNPDLWCDLADVLDDTDAAMTAYDYALLLDGKMAQAYCGKAALLNEMDMTAEAEELLLKGAEACSHDADICDMLMDLYAERQDYDSAMLCCQKMIAEDPHNPNLWINIARVSVYMEKYEDALEACDVAMLLDEELDTVVYEVKATIYMAMGLPDKELEMYKAMLQTDVHDVVMVHEVGFIYESRGDNEAAFQIYTAAIAANPKDSTLHTRMSLLLSSMDKVVEAYRYAHRAVMLDQQSSPAWSLMASLEWRWGKQKKMLRSLKNALLCKECSTGAIALLYELVIANTPGALSLVEDAENARIDSPIAYCYMAALFFVLDNMPKCLRWLEQALNMDADNSTQIFFELCPKAKKKSEIKKLIQRMPEL
ncbi:MAG: tetratricopeptide repeat protein [Prevotellaceae bacterium]|nr:tetratricopeptide repeat protein [Prevotellaceae bacterium]